jgi:hypothetical protein
MSTGDLWVLGIVGSWLVVVCGFLLEVWALFWLFSALSWLFA